MVNAVLMEMILYFGKDARRINHALKVLGFADTIADQEKVDPKTRLITAIAAILHDIGIKESEIKYQSASGRYQEIEGPPVAREILKRLHIEDDIIERVCFLIGHHHTYHQIDGIDFQILVEADFLVNIFEDELSDNAIEKVGNSYFITSAGKTILDSMYSKL